MIKVGYSLLSVASGNTPTIILFAGIRFFIAGALTIIIFSIIGGRALVPQRSSLPHIAALSVFQTALQYLFFYLGLAFTTGAKAAVENGCGVLFVLLLSCFVFRQERFTAQKLVACVLGFAGVAISSCVGISGFSFGKGDLFIILSAFSYAVSNVLMRKYSAAEDPAMLSGYQFMLGGAVMIITGFLLGGHLNINIPGAAVILYLALVSAIAYSLWSLLLKYNDASSVAVFGSLTPIFGFFLSLLILREQGTGLVINAVALVLVASGIFISNIRPKSDCN